jgi:putative MATE family efflux protein
MAHFKQSVLDTDNIGNLLLKLAIPAFTGMFVVALYNVVNTIFIGHYIGPLGIAGLSLVFPYQMLGMGIGQITGMGGASLISRLLGANNTAKAEKALGNAISFNIALSVFISIVVLVNPDFWLRLSGADDAVLPYARDYMIVIFYGMIANTFAMSFNGLTISQGNTRLPMIAQISGAVINIILDAVFIIWMGWGTKGAAIGTVIAQFVTAGIFLSYYLFSDSYLKIRVRNLVPDFKIIKEILAIGISALAATLASSVTGIIVMRIMVQYGGDLALSTFGIINRILMFSIMPGMVIGQAMQPIAGFNYGARHYDRVLRVIKIAVISSSVICLAAFCLLYFLPEPLVKIFTTDTDLINACAYAMKRAFFFIYFMGFLMVGTTLFQALGKASQSFITSLARSALLLIPCMFIMTHFLGLEGVWLSFPITDALSCVLVAVLLMPQLRNLRQKRAAENAGLVSRPVLEQEKL